MKRTISHENPDGPHCSGPPATKCIRSVKKRVPWGIHLVTAIHGMGALALIVMAVGCSLSESFTLSLIASPEVR